MTMTWANFAAALDGRRDASEALDALTGTSPADFQEMLDAIGAAEAGPLIAQARAADAEERHASLAAALDLIDTHLPVVGGPATSPGRPLFGRRRAPANPVSPSGDMLRSALLAALIDSALGGDPESLRSRLATATTGWESALAADLNGASKSERAAETSSARLALRRVLQLLMNDLESR